MIKVDISNVWGSVEFADLMEIEKEVSAAHAALDVGTEEVKRYRGWRNLPARLTDAELSRMEETAARLRSQSDAVVVVGVGGASLGARAAIELLQGQNRNIGRGTKGNPQIFYAGNSLSTRQWNELCRILDDRDFSIAIVSKSGTATETAIATRALRWRLERKYGTDGARGRIVAVTDPVQGALRQMANEEGWETFSIPPDVSGRFSVLSAAGLLPMAVAGVDIRRVLAAQEQPRRNMTSAPMKIRCGCMPPCGTYCTGTGRRLKFSAPLSRISVAFPPGGGSCSENPKGRTARAFSQPRRCSPRNCIPWDS